jgi:hypothetical protein
MLIDIHRLMDHVRDHVRDHLVSMKRVRAVFDAVVKRVSDSARWIIRRILDGINSLLAFQKSARERFWKWLN